MGWPFICAFEHFFEEVFDKCRYWQTAGERKGENPMKTPLPYIIIFGMSTPFVILAIAFANGWIKVPPRWFVPGQVIKLARTKRSWSKYCWSNTCLGLSIFDNLNFELSAYPCFCDWQTLVVFNMSSHFCNWCCYIALVGNLARMISSSSTSLGQYFPVRMGCRTPN